MKLLRGLAIISTTAAIPQADGGEETWPEISDDGPMVPPEFDRNVSDAPMGFAGRSSASARNIFFNPKAGYIVAEHKEDCWTKCGRRSRWSGKCSYCNLSNGSPGFCCHPDGRGSGCTGSMIRAVRNARMGRQYQCVVPKEFDSITSTSLKVLEKRDCWAKCGSIKGFAGKCDYCGPQGYCCKLQPVMLMVVENVPVKCLLFWLSKAFEVILSFSLWSINYGPKSKYAQKSDFFFEFRKTFFGNQFLRAWRIQSRKEHNSKKNFFYDLFVSDDDLRKSMCRSSNNNERSSFGNFRSISMQVKKSFSMPNSQ